MTFSGEERYKIGFAEAIGCSKAAGRLLKGKFIFGYGPMTFLRDFRTLKASVRAHGPVLLRRFCSHSKSAFASHIHFDVSIGPLA